MDCRLNPKSLHQCKSAFELEVSFSQMAAAEWSSHKVLNSCPSFLLKSSHPFLSHSPMRISGMPDLMVWILMCCSEFQWLDQLGLAVSHWPWISLMLKIVKISRIEAYNYSLQLAAVGKKTLDWLHEDSGSQVCYRILGLSQIDDLSCSVCFSFLIVFFL